MVHQKIINLLDDKKNQPSKFRTKNWAEINDESIDYNEDNDDDDDDDDDDNNNSNNNNNNNNNNFPETRKYWFHVQRRIVSSHGEMDPLSLSWQSF